MSSLETKQDDALKDLWEVVRSVERTVSNINGRLAGYLLAATLLGTVVAIIAQFAFGHIANDRVTAASEAQQQQHR